MPPGACGPLGAALVLVFTLTAGELVRTKIEARWCPRREGAGETPVTCSRPESCPEERLLWTGGDGEGAGPRRLAACGPEGEGATLVCCLPPPARLRAKRFAPRPEALGVVTNDLRNQRDDALPARPPGNLPAYSPGTGRPPGPRHHQWIHPYYLLSARHPPRQQHLDTSQGTGPHAPPSTAQWRPRTERLTPHWYSPYTGMQHGPDHAPRTEPHLLQGQLPSGPWRSQETQQFGSGSGQRDSGSSGSAPQLSLPEDRSGSAPAPNEWFRQSDREPGVNGQVPTPPPRNRPPGTRFDGDVQVADQPQSDPQGEQQQDAQDGGAQQAGPWPQQVLPLPPPQLPPAPPHPAQAARRPDNHWDGKDQRLEAHSPPREQTRFHGGEGDTWAEEPGSQHLLRPQPTTPPEHGAERVALERPEPGVGVGVRSAQMCEQYAHAAGVGQRIVASSLLLGEGPEEAEEALVHLPPACPAQHTPLVVGGQNASGGEFPHMAAIGFRGSEAAVTWLCGGSLISDRFVLTAAHCAHTAWGPPAVVRLGTPFLSAAPESDPDPGALEVPVESAITHYGYAPPSRQHDIALLRLDRAVSLSAGLRPACLPAVAAGAAGAAPHQEPPAGTVVVATGWGRLSSGGDTSDVLQKVSLRIWDWNSCAQVFGGRVHGQGLQGQGGQRGAAEGLGPGVVCAGAGVPRSNKDTCQGDSGGPLQVAEGCSFRVLGITSYGRECGLGLPAVYTKVTHYISWIEDIVWPRV